MLAGLNLFDGDAAATRRQTAACEALLGLAGVEPVNVQFARGAGTPFPGLRTVAALTQDSIGVTGSSGRRKPLASEIFDVLAAEAAARGHQHFAYLNSDIVLTPALVEVVRRERRQAFAVSRCDVAADGRAVEMVTPGQDVFVVEVDWWRRHRPRFRPYVLGDACWDNVYTAVMMCHADGRILNRDPLVRHERHEAIWRDDTPTARYNGYLAALDARYFSMWSRYWHRLETLRVSGAPAAAEEDLQRQVFVWRRSAPEAMRQLVRSARARRRYHRLRGSWAVATGLG